MTRKALIELLISVFQDERLIHRTGIFALEALDTTDARQMLDTQLSRLVSATVRDTTEGVQRAEAVHAHGFLRPTLRKLHKQG